MATPYQPQKSIKALGSKFYDPVKAAKFPKMILRHRNDGAANSIGLSHLSDAQWCVHFGQFKPLPDNLEKPLALRYHGHQFRHYNPDIGDGRGFLFAQMKDALGRLLDLGTKGSGQTPWSRAGDGRLTLLGGVREVLASHYLGALGVETSRAFSLIETGEALTRSDEPSPARSAVLVRLSHSHIRFGTFQRCAFENNVDGLEKLSAYCLEHYYPDSMNNTSAELLMRVVQKSAQTVAAWMAAGFVHGVMNTDNMNITGESFDYGPYRFSPTFKPDFTAAYFDHQGLYAFGRQPQALYWNLGQLANCLALIEDDKALIKTLETFPDIYQEALRTAVFKRLGITPSKDKKSDIKFVVQTFKFLTDSQADLAQFYFDFRGGDARLKIALKGPNKQAYEGRAFGHWLRALGGYGSAVTAPQTDKPVRLIHDDIEKLWAPIAAHDDWSAFDNKLAALKMAV